MGRKEVFIKGVSIQSVITLVMGIIEMVVFAIFSRLLSKSDFGYYAALTGIVAICGSISEAGLGSAIIQKKDDSSEHYSTAFTLSLVLGLICSLLLFLLAPILAQLVADETLTNPLRLMSFSLLFHSMVSIGNSRLLRKLEFKKVGVIQFTAYVSSASIGIVLAYFGWGLWSVVLFNFLTSLFTSFLLFVRKGAIPKLKIYKSESKSIISFGGWLTFGVILNNITRQMDKLFLAKWMSVAELGSYNRPSGFVTTITSKINGIFDTVLFPMLSSIQDQKEKIVDVFRSAVSLLNSFSIVLASFFFFNAGFIIRLFFGSQWIDLIPIMQIISINIIFSIDNRLVDCFFRSLNLVKLGFFLRLFGAILTFFALYVGSKFGLLGVSAGAVSAYVLMVIIKLVSLCKSINASAKDLFGAFIKAWKPAALLILVGCIFNFVLPDTIVLRISLVVLFTIICVIEFVLFPNMVSDQYASLSKPYIKKILGRFKEND